MADRERERDLDQMTREQAIAELRKLQGTNDALVKKIVSLSADVDMYQRDAEHWRMGSGKTYNQKKLLVEIVRFVSDLDPATMHPDADKIEVARTVLLRTANKLLLEYGEIHNGG